MYKLPLLDSASRSGDAVQLSQLVILLSILQNSVNGQSALQLQPTSIKYSTATIADERFLHLAKEIDKIGQEVGNSVKVPEFKGTVPGKAGVDYPNYSQIPSSTFTCSGRPTGYYADEASRCQVFHVCYSSRRMRKQSFLCPNGTIFNQRMNICEWWTKVDCRNSIASAQTRLKNDTSGGLDAMSSQTREVDIVYPAHSRLDTKRNDSKLSGERKINNTISRHEMKFLLDDLFSNLTDKVPRHLTEVRENSMQKYRRLPKENRGSVSYRSSSAGTISNKPNSDGHDEFRVTNYQNGFNNYSNPKIFKSILNSDRLSMIDKLIYSGSKEANDSRTGAPLLDSISDETSALPSNHTVEKIPSLMTEIFRFNETSILNEITKRLNPPYLHAGNKNNISLIEMNNLNKGFVRYKAHPDRVDFTSNRGVDNTSAGLFSGTNLNKKLNLTQYGIYYLSNGNNNNGTSGRYISLVKDRDNNSDALHSERSFQSYGLNEQFLRNSNYNDYGRIRQNTVVPSITKVSDILTGLHDLRQIAGNGTTRQKTIGDRNNSAASHQAIKPAKVQPNQYSPALLYHNNTPKSFNQKHNEYFENNEANLRISSVQQFQDYYKIFAQLKELNKNKVRVNPMSGKPEPTKTQVAITQRPVYQFKNTAPGFGFRDNMNSVKYVQGGNTYGNNIFNETSLLNDVTALGSTSLYGLDLIASTSNFNEQKNQSFNDKKSQNAPALAVFDIHDTNQLQGVAKTLSLQPQTVSQGLKKDVANRNISYKTRPAGQESAQSSQPTNGRYLVGAHQPHDSVVVLRSLGFSLNSEDDIKAFNQAISSGLFNESK